MDAIHYLTGYDRSTGGLRAELQIPRRCTGAVQSLIEFDPLRYCAQFVPPDLVETVAQIADLALPASAGTLDWFLDLYSRDG